MYQYLKPEAAVADGAALAKKKGRLQRRLLLERAKLESMIIRQYEKGSLNLGSNLDVLKQSSVLDNLLVDIMLLENSSSSVDK